MQIKFHKVLLKKRFPLAISRGVRGDSFNLFLSYEKDGFVGWGEGAPGKNEKAATVDEMIDQLEFFLETEKQLDATKALNRNAKQMGIAPCAYAALDMALWDWKAKKARLPLHELIQFPKPSVPTSLTLGIIPPEQVKERISLLLDNTSAKALKIKLGSPKGIEADQQMFAQVLESVKKYQLKIRVDANGGWSTKDAIHMMKWLADRGVDYIEQPLEEGQESELKYLFPNRPLPIFIDESCRYAEDVGKWADCIDGVNIKLMKCGGITEALQIIENTKKYSLKSMIGCMSESSVSIAAGAALSGGIDHIDLDSHYNLAPDPASGVQMLAGVTVPDFVPGHGGILKPEHHA
ncbi:MAG: dipeptide epimerase [Flavobacteriaceae bacterium]|jgi:L-alanine-DL-glutamate epimerase-like enolase superfamily enzyme